jgi:WD40 repeat protein
MNGRNGEVVVASINAGTVIQRVLIGQNPVGQLAWSPDGRRIAVGNMSAGFGLNPQTGQYGKLRDTTVLQILDAGSAKPVAAVVQPVGGGVESIDFSPDGRWLVSTTADGTLRIWDSNALEQVQLVAENLHPNAAIARFSPDGRRLALVRTGLGRVTIYRLQ